MKKNLRSACLLFLVFIFFVPGFVGIGSADENINDNYSYLIVNESSKWGKVDLPETDYPIWGYTDKCYNFYVTTSVLLNNSSDITMVFYWDCLNNTSNYSHFVLNNSSYLVNTSKDDSDPNNITWKCNNKWNYRGNYSVAVGMFELNNGGNWVGKNVSYWIPVQIRNNTKIIVQNLSMLDEKKGFEGNYSTHLYKNNTTYCGYEDNDYSFSVKFNATSQSNADNRTISETTTVVYWDYGSSENASGNSILGNISDEKVISDNNVSNISINNTNYIYWDKNFTHEWDDPGKKNISAIFFHWDPLDGSEMYSDYNKISEYKNNSILIIRDPKNFFPTSSISIPNNYIVFGLFLKIVNLVIRIFSGIFSNLQNWGILLSILGLIIFFFTYTRNDVPIEISIFERKPFYMKSVNSFTGTLIFVAGMYLYFVFGRCPWDIPIVSGLNWLSNLYFGVLYYEYTTPLLGNTSLIGIPYLSILLGLIDVVTLSLVIHMIAIPFYRGELKIGKYSRRKSSSTSAQPELISSPVETIINQKD